MLELYFWGIHNVCVCFFFVTFSHDVWTFSPFLFLLTFKQIQSQLLYRKFVFHSIYTNYIRSIQYFVFAKVAIEFVMPPNHISATQFIFYLTFLFFHSQWFKKKACTSSDTAHKNEHDENHSISRSLLNEFLSKIFDCIVKPKLKYDNEKHNERRFFTKGQIFVKASSCHDDFTIVITRQLNSILVVSLKI